jgi:hypothetical protein
MILRPEDLNNYRSVIFFKTKHKFRRNRRIFFDSFRFSVIQANTCHAAKSIASESRWRAIYVVFGGSRKKPRMHFQTPATFSMKEEEVIFEMSRYPVSLDFYDPDYSSQPVKDNVRKAICERTWMLCKLWVDRNFELHVITFERPQPVFRIYTHITVKCPSVCLSPCPHPNFSQTVRRKKLNPKNFQTTQRTLLICFYFANLAQECPKICKLPCVAQEKKW